MSQNKELHNPGFVEALDCVAKHEKLDLALFGKDGRGGIVRDIAEIKNYMELHRESGRNWKNFLYPVIGGAIVALFAYALRGL